MQMVLAPPELADLKQIWDNVLKEAERQDE